MRFKRFSGWFLIFVLSALGQCVSAQDEDPAEVVGADPDEAVTADWGYQVSPGDILNISVWREEDLEETILVRPDGGISFPLAGDLDVSGMTIKQIQEAISTRLEKFLNDPVVTVTAAQLAGHQIYIIGQVQEPGRMVVNHYVDVVQALSLARGMTPFAKKNDIKILRREDGVERAFSFKFSDIEDGKNLHQNIILQSGDVIVVP